MDWGWIQDHFVYLANTVSPDVLKNLKTPPIRTSPLSRVPGSGDLLAAYCDFQKIGAVFSRVHGNRR